MPCVYRRAVYLRSAELSRRRSFLIQLRIRKSSHHVPPGLLSGHHGDLRKGHVSKATHKGISDGLAFESRL